VRNSFCMDTKNHIARRNRARIVVISHGCRRFSWSAPLSVAGAGADWFNSAVHWRRLRARSSRLLPTLGIADGPIRIGILSSHEADDRRIDGRSCEGLGSRIAETNEPLAARQPALDFIACCRPPALQTLANFRLDVELPGLCPDRAALPSSGKTPPPAAATATATAIRSHPKPPRAAILALASSLLQPQARKSREQLDGEPAPWIRHRSTLPTSRLG
jgi:hypothetical protein